MLGIVCVTFYPARISGTYLGYIQKGDIEVFERLKPILGYMRQYEGRTQRDAIAYYFRRKQVAQVIADEDHFDFEFKNWPKPNQKKLVEGEVSDD